MTEEAIRAESPLDSRGGGGDSGRTEDVFRSDPTGEGLERAGQESWRQRIAERAYALYEEAGRPDGSDLEHWLEAEREVGGAPEQWDH